MRSLSAELLEEIVAISSQSLLVVDASSPEFTIVYANSAYEEISGYCLSDLKGTAWLDHAAADEDAAELVQLRRRIACEEAVEVSLPFLRKDGDVWLGRLRLNPLRTEGRKRRLWLIQCQENDRSGGASAELLKRALGNVRGKLASLDRTDQVTGLMSRAQFSLLLRRDLALARRERRPLNLLLFRVPELDVYRQTFGDNAADSCLRMIGAQIAGTFRRASDLCARFDETTVAVALPGQEQEEVRQLVPLVEKKVRNLGLHNPRGRLGRHVIVHGHWVAADPAGDDLDGLMTRCAVALGEFEQPEAKSAVSGAA